MANDDTDIGIMANDNTDNKTNRLKKWLGLLLVILSFSFYGCLLLVPFVPFSAGNKLLLSSLLVVFGEASFWIAVLILGKELVSKYRNNDWRSKMAGLFDALSEWISKSENEENEN